MTSPVDMLRIVLPYTPLVFNARVGIVSRSYRSEVSIIIFYNLCVIMNSVSSSLEFSVAEDTQRLKMTSQFDYTFVVSVSIQGTSAAYLTLFISYHDVLRSFFVSAEMFFPRSLEFVQKAKVTH